MNGPDALYYSEPQWWLATDAEAAVHAASPSPSFLSPAVLTANSSLNATSNVGQHRRLPTRSRGATKRSTAHSSSSDATTPSNSEFAALAAFPPPPPPPPPPPQIVRSRNRHPRPTMTSSTTQDEYSTLQRLSDQYRPEPTGPLVGERQSTEAIANEYADADPIFVRKTAALPQKYSHYRTVRGDGNCGWRAIGFSYFETFALLGDRSRALQELARLKSMNNLLNRAGFQSDLYEDYVEVTFELVAMIANAASPESAVATLSQRFSEDDVSNAVIAYLRLLTSAWMKAHPDTYLPYVPDGLVDRYCATQIEPFQAEIEHVGLKALIDVLINPAGFSVEVLYLDRSAGSEVTRHLFEAPPAMAMDGGPSYPTPPTICLLYRPGHYDILYPLQQVQVNFVPTVSAFGAIHGTGISGTGGDVFASILHDIPGISAVSLQAGGMGVLGGLSSPVKVPDPFAAAAVAAVVGTPASPVPPPLLPDSSGLSMSPAPLERDASSSVDTGALLDAAAVSFRPSRYELQAGLQMGPASTSTLTPQMHAQQHWQTTSFKNSPFNPAHFQSEQFQPEMWTPESEGFKSATGFIGSGSGSGSNNNSSDGVNMPLQQQHYPQHQPQPYPSTPRQRYQHQQ